MEFVSDILQFRFLQNALMAAVLSGIACGIIGTYIVARRSVFLSGGITHASFGGIGIAYYLGLNPMIGALTFSVAASLGIELAGNRAKIREDSAIGIVWSVGMALGIIFVYLTPGYAPNLMTFLFGNILTVTGSDIVSLVLLDVVLLTVALLWLRPIMYVAFDREYARSRGVPVGFVSGAMAVLVACTIVLSIRSIGIMMLISLLTIPVVIVNTYVKRFAGIAWRAAVVAVAGNIAGLYVSYKLDIPSGAATIFVLAIALILVKLLPLCRKRPCSLQRKEK